MGKSLFCATTLLLTISFTSFSQTLKIEFDSAKVYLQQNKFVEAASWLEKAKISAKANPADTASYAEVLRLLAVSYARASKLPEAEAIFKESIDVYASMPSKKNQMASSLMNFGVFYYNQKKYKEALPIFNRAYQVKMDINSGNSVDNLMIINSLANTQLNLGMYVDAEETFKKLVKGRLELVGGNHPEYIQACNSLANLYKTIQRNDKALEMYLEILEGIKASKTDNSKEYAQAAMNVANMYKSISNFPKAENYYLQAHDIFQKVSGEANLEYAGALINLAGVMRLQGKYVASEPLYFKAQNIFRDVSGEISADYASVLNNIAIFYNETGKYDLAESAYKNAIEISRQTLGERHPEMATTYSNLGLLYKSMGRYEQSEPVLKKSQKIRKEVLGELHPDYAASLNNLAGLYEYTGRISEAEPLYKQSLSILKNAIGTKNSEYASTLNNLAGIYEAQKKYAQAEPLYSEALGIIKEIYGESHPDYATTLNNLALLLESLGKKEEAEKLYKINIDFTKQALGEKHPNYATSLNNYAILLENMARYNEAEKCFILALAIRKEALGENHPSYTTTLYDLAKLYAATKDYAQADLYWDKALNNYLYQIDQFFPTMSEREKGKFYQTISPKFEQFNSYALLRSTQNSAIIGKMYDYQLATKALLLNSTNKVKQRILNSGDFILIEKYKNWTSQKELLSKAVGMSKEEQKTNGLDIDQLGNGVNDLEKELTASSEIFRATNDTKSITWIDIQKKLKADEAAIEMIRFTKYRFDSSGIYTSDSVFYAALLLTSATKNSPELVVLKNGIELEKQYLKYYRNSIKNKLEDEFAYNQYWSKIKRSIPTTKKIYLSPDGVYNLVNLNTLKNVQTKSYIYDEVDLRIVTNTKDLLSVGASANPENKITLMGSPDFAMNTKNVASVVKGMSPEQSTFIERAGAGMLAPLPGTKIEVEKIAGMLNSNAWLTEVYLEHNAIEDNLKKVENPKILHIATHGFFEQDKTGDKNKDKKDEEKAEENPLLKSGLMLAGASLTLLKRKNEVTNVEVNIAKFKEDGILTAYEAMNLNLDKTDLVVLSACETGLGEVKNGEGVYGLQRAFNVAGAKALIISLWTVNDAATQKLMTSFYTEMLKPNATKRSAFRNAQLELRKEFAEPYFWGAFVMIGE
ncbi:MAG: CHAT domain-containing protein [Cytophagales bacterium]